MIIITGIVTAIALLIGIGSIYFYGNDNPVEEVAEDIIEEITGIENIDLSPQDEGEK